MSMGESILLHELLRRQPRQPMDERLPNGQSVQELLANAPLGIGVPPPSNPAVRPRTAGGPIVPTTIPEVRMGQQLPTGISRLGQLMAHRNVLSTADPSSKVRQTPWGIEEGPPEQSPSRGRQALIGVLQGANMAAQATSGDPWATLAGAATGAAAGGISPRLMQAFTRRQEQDKLTGDITTEQALQLKNAQVYNEQVEPVLKEMGIRRQAENDLMMQEDRLRRDVDRDADRSLRARTADEANKQRQRRLEEQERHNKAVEGKTTATEEITVGGRKFFVSPSTAARILEARSIAANKPDKADKDHTEAAIEADLETEAANDHLSKRKAADDQASVLRAEREKLMAGTGAIKNKGKVAEIDRQIAQAEKEVTYRQKEADDAFGRARKAQAKAKTAGGSTGGRTIEGAVEAFKAKMKREPTADEIARMKRALGQ